MSSYDDKADSIKAKVAMMLETRHETEKETMDALRILSTFCSVDSSLARRNFANTLEDKNLETYESFVAAFGVLIQRLDVIYNDVLRLNASIDNMASQLHASKSRTHRLITQTSALQDEKSKLEKRLVLANAFIEHFRLAHADAAALHQSTVSLDFFAALEKIDTLHNDCKTLVHAGFETAALDLMDKIALHKESAVERLYRWAQTSCRTFDPLDVDSLVPTAMSTLQSRPVLFKYVVDEYCTARKSCMVRAFIDALTKHDGNTKPIEHHADDPKRYVGDILAWIHQALPAEKESLVALFKLCKGVEEDSHAAIVEITEGLCHPLKVRFELILTPDKEALLLCALTSLIRFYSKILDEEVPGGSLAITLNELQKQSEKVFLTAVERKVQNDLSRGVKAPPSDLTPSSIVAELLKFLRDLLAITPASEQRERSDLSRATSLIVDPLLRAIDETACHLSSTDSAAYLLNCIYQIQCTISLCQFKNDYVERLQAQADAQMDTLTSEQASSLVANLNLSSIYTILQEHQPQGSPLSAVAGMEASSLKVFMNKLDGFVAMPDAFLLPQISLLMSSSNRTSIRRRSFLVIMAIYKKLHTCVHDPVNMYENPSTIVRRSPEEVSELLSLS